MLMNPHCDEMADLLVREKVDLVTTGAGRLLGFCENV